MRHKPKRVVFVGDLGSAFRAGGGQAFSREYLKILMKDEEYTVASYIATCRRLDGDTSPAPAGSVRIGLPDMNFGRITTLIPLTIALWRRIRTPPDLYVFDQPLPAIYYLPRAPAVCMFHGPHGASQRPLRTLRGTLNAALVQPSLKRLHREFLLLRMGLPMFNSYHTLQRCTGEESLDAAPLSPYVTHLPVDTAPYDHREEMRQRVRSALNVHPSEVLVSYISNFSPAKRVHLAVDAARHVLSRVPRGVRFLFVGRPIASAALEAFLAEPQWHGRAIRLMEVRPEDVPGFFAASDIAISTSQAESFGYTVAEAMAAGLPQVVFNAGALQELVEHGRDGFVVEDAADFMKALMRLIESDGLRSEMGRHAHASVRRRLSTQAFRSKAKVIAEEAMERFHGGFET